MDITNPDLTKKVFDITNPDLTKKVLRALNPNEILSEDKFDKQRLIVSRRIPPTEEDNDIRIETITRGRTDSIDEALKKRGVDVSKLDNKTSPKNLIEPSNFKLEYLNAINDKETFLNFIDTIYDIYPKVIKRKDRKYGIDVYNIMDRALELYNTKFIVRPYSQEPLNSGNFDKLFELKEELRKKLYPEPSLAKKTGTAFGTAASATRKGVGIAASATGKALGNAASATRKGVGKAATATGKALGTAASATGKALGNAASATRKGVGKAATATGKALGTAASATRKGVGKAASRLGTAARSAASSTGRLLGKAIPNRFKRTQAPAPIHTISLSQRLMNNPEERQRFIEERRRSTQRATAPNPVPIVQGRTGPTRRQPRRVTNPKVGFKGNPTTNIGLFRGRRYPTKRNTFYKTVKPSNIGDYNISDEAVEARKPIDVDRSNTADMNNGFTPTRAAAAAQRRQNILNKLKGQQNQVFPENSTSAATAATARSRA